MSKSSPILHPDLDANGGAGFQGFVVGVADGSTLEPSIL